ncbi:MAG: hypothetical protein AAF222_07870 [Pseudomonadota bacterium]
MVNFTKFLQSEDGAVTVDWVVLTAAIVGLSVVVVAAVASGATDVSGSLGANLNDATPPEAAMPVF